MDHKNKSKEELAEELNELRQTLRNMELERYELEKTLVKSLARYRAIIEDQTELICRFEPDFTLTFVNDAYCRFFNKKREDLLGFSFMPLIPPEHRKKVKTHFDSLGAKNSVATHEHQVIGKKGEIRWQQWTNRAIFDDQGVIKEFQAVGHDITARKLAEEALCQARDNMEQKVKERTREILEANEQLKREIKNRKREKSRRRESEAYMEAILNAAPVGIGLVKNRVLGWVSHRMSLMLGYSADELVGQSARIAYESEEEFDRVGRVKYAEIKKRGIGTIETRFRCKNGSVIHVLMSSSPLDPEDLPRGVIFTVLDITQRKQAEQALRDSEEKYRRLVETSIDGIAIVQGTEIKFANQALLDMYGVSEAEGVVGKNFTEFVSREYRDLLLQRGLERERGKDVLNRYEFKALRQNGIEFDVEISVNPVPYEGKPARQAVLRDVTARKRGEKYIRESEQKYRLLVENLPSIVYKGYKDWSVDFVDEKIEALTGYSMDEFNSRRMKWSELIVEEDLAWAKEIFIKALKVDKSYVREYRIKTKGEDILWIEERAMILCDQKGEIDYVSGVFFDITEQRKAQEALSRSEAELLEKSRHLEEVNAALNVLLKRREEDKNDLEENILSNVKELVLPYIERLKNSRLRSEQMTLVGILDSNIKEILSPFATKLSSRFLSLTPAEIKVASLIKDGKTSKEIASLLHTSENTIRSHRFHIRSKLDLKNKKVNLRSYLRSLQE
jgi:PAS domain S-box-containing protein